MRHVWHTVMKVSLAIFGIFFVSYCGFASYYLHTSAAVPNARTGSVYPLNIHGWVVYLDHSQHFLLGVLEAIQIICAAACAIARIATLRRISKWVEPASLEERRRARMIIKCDSHRRYQRVSMLGAETKEMDSGDEQ